jgi:hypothetical protein
MKYVTWGRNMQKILYCKTLAIGIIVFFIGANAVTSAVNINSDLNKGIRENYKIESSDEYTEIISLIGGSGVSHGPKEGLFHLNVTNGNVDITSFTTKGFYKIETNKVSAKFFIGYDRGSGFGFVFGGIAIGDISW